MNNSFIKNGYHDYIQLNYSILFKYQLKHADLMIQILSFHSPLYTSMSLSCGKALGDELQE